jgi:putative hydrolase of the HAD superfamily
VAYRAVVFDLFDTLVDLHYDRLPRDEHQGRPVPPTARALHSAVAQRTDIDFATFLAVASAVDEEFRVTRYAQNLELPTEERFQAMALRFGVDDRDLPGIMTEIHMGAIREQTAAPPHHAEILADIGSRVRIGLCSNFSHSATALRILDESGLRPHFDSIIISDAVGIRKPHPDIFRAVLDELDVAPDEALHVGDNLRADVDGAASCGIPTVWITRRVRDANRQLSEHSGARPEFVIEDLKEIAELLDRSDS